MSRLGTETAFEVLARAGKMEAAGRSVIHLEIGEPDFDTPPQIVEAGVQAINNGSTHYSPSPGIDPLRSAIADHVSRTRQISVSPEQVVVTPGAKPIVFYALLALAQEGDEVLYPNPGFPIYESMINFVGAKAVPIPLREELDFELDPAELRTLVTPRTKMIILNSPHNPTGGVLTRETLSAVASVAIENDLTVLSDEIYREIVYGTSSPSITEFPGMIERTIILDGFSKTYAMTGWRLGYGVMPEELIPHVTRLVTNSVSCTATFVQEAGITALNRIHQETDQMLLEFGRRREAIVKGLNAIDGITCVWPAGAFYVFPNVKRLGLQSKKLADRLLDEAGVAALAGNDFGAYGDGFIRLSYANSIENIEEALDRIHRFTSSL